MIDSNANWPRSKIAVKRLTGDPESVVVENTSIVDSFFTDLSVFQVPPLGWRMAADGTYMACFRRNNKSYQRAVSPGVLHRLVSPATAFLIDTDNVDDAYYQRHETTAALIMKPKFVAFREGLEKMRKGELFSFCVNFNLAVIPARGAQQTLLFNTTKVGLVKKDGEVVCDIPQVRALIKDSTK
jgi:hypothetical protein